jgi:hypothetical protein
VQDVETTLDRAAEEINVWVDETPRAKGLGLALDLDHAAAMVAERIRERYAIMRDDADPELAVKYSHVGGTRTNVAGISHWIGKRPRTL